MLKSYGKYIIISSFILVLAFVMVSCGGGGVSGVPDTNSNPAPPFTPSTTTSASGYVYMTPEGEYKVINASNTDLVTAVSNGINGSTVNDTDQETITNWLGGFTPLSGEYIYLGTDNNVSQLIGNDGFFTFDSVPLYDTADNVYFGLTPAGGSESYFFEDYLFPGGDTFKSASLSSSQTISTLVSTPENLFLVSPTAGKSTEIFWVRGVGTDGKAIDLKSKPLTVTNTNNLGTVKFPYYVGNDKTRAYGFINVGKNVSGSTELQISTEGVNVSIPVEIVNRNSVGIVQGKVLHNGQVPDFGWVESVGPWAWDILDASGNYKLWKVYAGATREVKATYWVWNGNDFDKFTQIIKINLASGETKIVDFGGGGGVPTVAPTVGPTVTPTPSAILKDYSGNIPTTGLGLTDVQAIGDNVWITNSSSSVVFRSTNGGSTFTSPATTAVSQAVFMLNSSNGWIAGLAKGHITTDGGSTWTSHTIGGTLYDIYFPTSSVGYAVGGSGAVYRTGDGGTTWTKKTAPTSGIIYSVAFPSSSDPNTGYVTTTASSVLYKTTDGGTSWTSISLNSAMKCLEFIDANTGWAVGGSGKIYSYKSGTWTEQTSPVTTQLNGISFTSDGLNGWAVGNSGVILHTTDGGNKWTQEGSGLTTQNLLKVDVVSSTVAYIVGSSSTFIKYTTN